jgi:hypothetical protein
LNPSATFHLPKPNNDTTPCWTKSPWLRNLNQMASGDPGAVQILQRRRRSAPENIVT